MTSRQKHIIFQRLATLVVVCCMSMGAFAQQMPEVNVKLQPQQILIGEQVQLDVKVERDAATQLFWPQYQAEIQVDSSRTVEILNTSAIDTTNQKDRVVEHRAYTVTAWDTGVYLIPPVKIGFKHAATDSLHTVQSLPTMLTVIPMVVDTTKPIKPIKDPQDMPFKLAEIENQLIIGGLILLLIAVLVAYFILRKPKAKAVIEKPKPTEPAHVIALRKLQELEAKKLWENDEIKLYYSELTDILREYLELRYDFYAVESTTEEILERARKLDMSPTNREQLDTIFSRADLIKFAKQLAYSQEHIEAMQLSRKFVGQTQLVKEKEDDKGV